MKLYDIATEYRDILAWMADHEEEMLAEGGDHPELVDRMERIEATFDVKAESIALLIQELATTAAAIKTEADRLAARARSEQSHADRLKGYLLAQMRRAGLKRAGGDLASVTIAKNGRPSIAVPDGAEIPEWCRRVRIELDGTAAYYRLKAAGALPDEPGVYTIDGLRVERGLHLRIR